MTRKPLWLNRSLIELQLHYCLVLSNEEYTAAVIEVEGPNAHVGYWQKSETAGATVTWATDAEGTRHAIVALRVPPEMKGYQIASLLCHEAVHIWQEHCRQIGEDTPSDEFAAWSIQHIAQLLMQDYAERLA